MTVGELKKVLVDVPDEIPVGVIDFYGRMEVIDGVEHHARGPNSVEKREWLEIDIPYIGR